MKVGIVGSGNVGRLYGALWAARGHQVTFTYVRDEHRLEDFVSGLGVNALAGEPEEVADTSEIVVFAPPFERIKDAATLVGPAPDKIILDTTNPFNPERTGLVDLGSGTSADLVTTLFPQALVVKALHNLSVKQAADALKGPPAVAFLAGESTPAKNLAARLVVDAGLIPVDTGGIASARLSEAPGPLFMTPYTVTEVAQALAEARAR